MTDSDDSGFVSFNSTQSSLLSDTSTSSLEQQSTPAPSDLGLDSDSARSQSPKQHLNKQLSFESPFVKQLSFESPSVKQLSFESPFVEQLSFKSPFVKQLSFESPLVKQLSYESPFVKQLLFESPLTSPTLSVRTAAAKPRRLILDDNIYSRISDKNIQHKKLRARNDQSCASPDHYHKHSPKKENSTRASQKPAYQDTSDIDLIKTALQREESDKELVGDFSRSSQFADYSRQASRLEIHHYGHPSRASYWNTSVRDTLPNHRLQVSLRI